METLLTVFDILLYLPSEEYVFENYNSNKLHALTYKPTPLLEYKSNLIEVKAETSHII